MVDVRADFPILSRLVNGRRLSYLDNAATTQKPSCVLDAERRYYETANANPHRGLHTLSNASTEAYEEARRVVAAFLNAEPEEIVFVRNATEGINLVAQAWGRSVLGPGKRVVVTQMEHHSNMVPWQQVAKEYKASVMFVPLNRANGQLVQEEYRKLLALEPSIVAVTHASNVLGTLNPVEEMISQAHEAGALVMLDACQSAPHMKIDVKNLDCDFLVFSGHKLYGPMGIGVLYAKRKLLEAMPPFLFGGDMIKEVRLGWSTWNDVPHKFEAGTPNVAGAVGLAEAIRYLQRIGMAKIQEHERHLVSMILQRFSAMGVHVVGVKDPSQRGSVVAFAIEGIPAHDVATLLDSRGVAVRSGHHCAQPLHEMLCVDATVRASVGIYNTEEDVEALVEGIDFCRKVFGGGR